MATKQIRCANCGDLIYPDQEKLAVKAKRGKDLMVFHKDHTGCVDSLRRRQDNKTIWQNTHRKRKAQS